ncbi:glycoside hydrolase family 15 protein [Oerskovia sp. M15]
MLETTWQTPTGWLVVRDAMLMGPWHNIDERSQTHRRTPTDFDAEHMLLRTILCVNGTVDVEVVCEPLPDYGREAAQWEYEGPTYQTLVTRAAHPTTPDLRLSGSLRLGVENRRAQGRTRMSAGDKAYVALSWSDRPAPSTWPDAADAMDRTEQYWRDWITQGVFPDHPWRSYLQRSALTLKGLTYAPTGALLAAATTSLPEAPHGERNWDYRYAWVRDSTFALWGLYTLGLDREADDFFAFVHDVCRDDRALQIMYGVGGEDSLEETTLDHLSGYEDARPVRVGNAAYAQQQHDMWVQSWTRRTCTPSPASSFPSRCGPCSRSRPRRPPGTGRSPTAGCGRCAGSRSTSRRQGHVLGRARPRRTPGPDVRRAGVCGPVAEGRRRDPCRRAGARRRLRGCSSSGTASTRWTPRSCSCRCCASCPRRPSRRGDRRGDRRGAHGQRPGAAVPDVRDRRRDGGEEGRSRSARSGWSRRSSRSGSSTGRGRCASACCRSRASSTSTRRRSTRTRGATWGTSAGVHAPCAHQRGGARRAGRGAPGRVGPLRGGAPG